MKIQVTWCDPDNQDKDVIDIFHLKNGECLWHCTEPGKNYLISLAYDLLETIYGPYTYKSIISIRVVE